MTLPTGSHLGPYEIVGVLGSGGMGDVYRARDTRLGRSVAIKVVQSRLAGNAELRERFEREARTISSFTHPNICTLYDVGREGDAEYLVMELLDGEPLSAKIARGPLPLSLLLRYAIQIADALDHAHRAGVIHRDLKPANVMITNSGAKLLDFGLAKLAENQPRTFSAESAPPTAIALTTEGSIIGTFHYMSPEQLEGKPLDQRTDMFSFGVVLYEMATGRRPFEGSSQASLIAAVFGSDPTPPRALQPSIPPELDRIIMTALEKSADDRWQSAQDVARQLRWLADSSASRGEPAPAPATRRAGARAAAWVAAAAVLSALLTWAFLSARAPRTPAAPALHLQLALPDGFAAVSAFDTNTFALSPDGSRLAFVASSGKRRSLAIRRLDSFEVTAVPDSDDATGPFWSPDGEWIGYAARGKLWKSRVANGGAAIPLCEVAPNGAVGAWGKGVILFSDAPGAGRRTILRVSDGGGVPEAVTVIDEKSGEWRHGWPVFLADGRRFLFQVYRVESVERQLVLGSLDSKTLVPVLPNVSNVALAEGRMLYVRNGTLLSQPFDPASAKLSGEPETVASDVGYFYATATAQFTASHDGTVVFRTDTSRGSLVEVGPNGEMLRTIADGEQFFSVDLAPDGRRAAVTIMNRGTALGDIWLFDLVRGVRERFTSDPGMEVFPVWAPDGGSIVYSRTGGGIYPYLVRRPLNAATAAPLAAPGFFDTATSFTPDGSALYFTRRDPQTTDHIFRLALAGNATPEPAVGSGFRERDAEISPDGKLLAFSTDASGQTEVQIQSAGAGTAQKTVVSTSGGRMPRWSRDGRTLYFIAGNRRLTAATAGAGGWAEPAVTPLFDAGDVIDFAPTGSGFVLCRSVPGATDSLFHVIVRR
ncbi:MAG TPA: protein kinase [Thermoanaerobaculia bacterium]